MMFLGVWIPIDRAKVPATRQGFKNQRTTKEGHILIFIAISSCYLDASLGEKVMATVKMPVAPGLRAGQLDLFSFLPSGREQCHTEVIIDVVTRLSQPHNHKTTTTTYTFNHIYIFMCFPKSNPTRIAPLRLIRMEAKTREAEAKLGRGAEAAESHLRRLAAADRKLGNHPAGKGLPGDLGSWGFGGAESAGFRWDFSIGILLSKIFFRIKKSKKTDKNGISKKRIKTGYHEMIADGIYIYIWNYGSYRQGLPARAIHSTAVEHERY